MRATRMQAMGLMLALGAVAWVPPSAQGGGIYRWEDEHGHPHFGDQPPHADSERVEPGKGRHLSLVDTVVVRRNAMRSVINQEVKHQQQGRQEKIRSIARDTARKERETARRCDALKKRITAAEAKTGSLLSGELRRLDDEHWQHCRNR